jgi:hypothetical protein
MVNRLHQSALGQGVRAWPHGTFTAVAAFPAAGMGDRAKLVPGADELPELRPLADVASAEFARLVVVSVALEARGTVVVSARPGATVTIA